MMEVGPWRWDGKSEEDFWVKPGGWDEYTTVVYGQFSMMENSSFLPHENKVDQPAGTGFSYTSTDRYVHTTDIVSSSTFARRVIYLFLQAQQQLLEFMKNFYDVFPEYKTRDVRVFLLVVCFLIHSIHSSKTYLAGESFAGQWIPYYGQQRPI